MTPSPLPGQHAQDEALGAPSIATNPAQATRIVRVIRIERLLGFACLAVFASIVATWTLAVCSPISIAPLPAFPDVWLSPAPADWPPPGGYAISARGFGAEWVIQSFDTADGSRASTASILEQPRSGGQVTIRAGWPFHALRADVTGPRVDSTSPHRPLLDHLTWTQRWRAGIAVPELVAVGAPGLGRPIPLVPIWSGMIGNIALWLAMVMPVPLAFEWRRWRRRRRSRCVECGHDLIPQQARCPECGSALIRAVRTSAVGAGATREGVSR